MIYTSYFGKYKGDNSVCIAIGANWFKGERASELIPDEKLVYWYKNKISYINSIKDKFENEKYIKNLKYKVCEIYKKEYLKQLNKLNPADIYNKYNEKVLLCFEKTGEFCHRHIITEWLKNAGYECQELI